MARFRSLKCTTVCFLLLILLVSICVAYAETAWEDLHAQYMHVPRLEYGGIRYRLKTRLTTILIAGIDHRNDALVSQLDHRSGGQADFLLLLVIDDDEKTMTPVQIDRDTVTDITVLNVLGNVSGTRRAQVCLSHSFGDGAHYSCELMASAISRLLKDVPVDHYFTLNMDGIATFNDALGGITVTLEEDFSFLDPDMTIGKTLLLRGKQAEIFVRQRMAMQDKTNTARQNRQRIYLNSAAEVLKEKLKKDTRFIVDFNALLKDYTVTDMSDGRMLNYVHSTSDYTMQPTRLLEGEHRVDANGFVEFIPNEDALLEMVVDLFYQPMS